MNARLLAVIVGGLKKVCYKGQPKSLQVHVARIRLRPDANHSQSLMDSNSAAFDLQSLY